MQERVCKVEISRIRNNEFALQKSLTKDASIKN